MTVPNPLALLAYSALAVLGGIVLLLTGHQVPSWLQAVAGGGLVGGVTAMTPGLHTVQQLLAPVLAASLPPPAAAGGTAPPAELSQAVTEGVSAADVEPAP